MSPSISTKASSSMESGLSTSEEHKYNPNDSQIDRLAGEWEKNSARYCCEHPGKDTAFFFYKNGLQDNAKHMKSASRIDGLFCDREQATRALTNAQSFVETISRSEDSSLSVLVSAEKKSDYKAIDTTLAPIKAVIDEANRFTPADIQLLRKTVDLVSELQRISNR